MKNNNQFFVILVLHTHTQDPSIGIAHCAKGFVILGEFTDLNTTKAENNKTEMNEPVSKGARIQLTNVYFCN